MWLNWSDFDVQQVHYEDLRRRADRDRLVALALTDHQPQTRLHCRVLSWLGRRMIAWGTDLQKRYSTGIGPFAAATDKPRQGVAA
jgi:hypothetical protein